MAWEAQLTGFCTSANHHDVTASAPSSRPIAISLPRIRASRDGHQFEANQPPTTRRKVGTTNDVLLERQLGRDAPCDAAERSSVDWLARLAHLGCEPGVPQSGAVHRAAR